MRIAWCTPFDRRSAIGRVSSLVVEELRRFAEVDIWHPSTADPFHTSVRQITLMGGPADAARLLAYDLAIYNMGNHLGNHREIFEASRSAPGLVVLHDIVLQHFFTSYYLEELGIASRYASAISRWYGRRGSTAVYNANGEIRPGFLGSPEVLDFPLFEEAIAASHAVVTHSKFSAERVRQVFAGLVIDLPLPYDLNHKGHLPSRASLSLPDGRVLAVTVGDVNPNKRIRSVLEVLGQHPELASRIFYVVVGKGMPGHAEELACLVKRYRLEKAVRFTGYASEELLRAYLTHADFCINLRYPSTETASASAIEAMLYGKPLIVSNVGFYEEFPDDCVLKVRLDHEIEDLWDALRRFADDPPRRQRMGASGRSYARETFRADFYARRIIKLGEQLLDVKPIFMFTDRVGEELARMGISADQSIISTVASISNRLFSK